MRKQTGFSLIEVVLVLALIIIVGLVGFNLYNMQQARNQDNKATQQQAAATPPPPATINSSSDLDASAKALDAATLDSASDTTALEQSANDL